MNKKGIYLVEFDDGIKFGKTTDMNKTKKFYVSPWMKPLKRIRYFPTINSVKIEKEIKKHFDMVDSKFIKDISFESVELVVITLLVIYDAGVTFESNVDW